MVCPSNVFGLANVPAIIAALTQGRVGIAGVALLPDTVAALVTDHGFFV